MGKPGTVSGGLWGSGADNATNYAILTNARWWKYKSEVPAYDTSPTAQAALMNDTEYLDGWVAGYNYFGYVMTDENGTIKYFGSAAGAVEAPTGSDGWVPIKADHCYHITAKTGQNSFIVATGTVKQAYTVKRTTACYQTAGADQTIELWYEREAGNSVDFALSAGLHDVVLMVTEESFHNQLGGLTNVDEGGYWQSTWVSDWTTNVSPKTGRAWTPVRGGSIRFTTPNTAPTASFTATPSGLSVSCVSTSTDADGTIASYAWTFGDGGVASGPNAAHTYAAAGTYTIALTVTDNLGLQSTTTRQVTVVAAPNNVMTATVYVTWLGSVGKYQPYAKVTVMANGAPCASAVVTGLFSGAFTSKASAVTTNASGVAEFYGPPRTKSTGALTFRVTKITKTGYTAAGLPVSGSY
ncbi:MAG: PKD domain-containing protein [Armatimonadetes bacterium]|nr:PKD domain-containing protein [Armatimonadota bacterium]